jgi:hypothetical protein
MIVDKAGGPRVYIASVSVCIALPDRMLLRGPEGPMIVGGARRAP